MTDGRDSTKRCGALISLQSPQKAKTKTKPI